MSKVATYLRGHVTGEAATRDDVREAYSFDNGVLAIKPEMVIYPRTTNDIRKITRFSWQLAEKGHVLAVTARGSGTSALGGALSKGAVLDLSTHMHRIFEYDAKQKLVRLQPGVTIAALTGALGLQGTMVMPLLGIASSSTVGGAIASGTNGRFAGKYGTITDAIDQLEVVLANGDVLQTGRVSRKEVSARKGWQSFEGDIYRGVDAVLEEYADVIAELDPQDTTGYNAIAKVKARDGSFDLTPLFVGSEGTLGIISEMIIRAEFRCFESSDIALIFDDVEKARDALDTVAQLNPAYAQYFDAVLFDTARLAGKTYACYELACKTISPAAVIILGFDDFNAHHRAKALKRVAKQFRGQDVVMVTTDEEEGADIVDALDVAYTTTLPDRTADAAPALYGDFSVPAERFEDFTQAIHEIEAKEHVDLPLSGDILRRVFQMYPQLALSKVSDKQKTLKLLDVIGRLVASHGGTMVAQGGEGRLKARASYGADDAREVAMYEAIRAVFDPHHTLSPGVKQAIDMRLLAKQLRSAHQAGYSER